MDSSLRLQAADVVVAIRRFFQGALAFIQQVFRFLDMPGQI
jgi:hypothetical protein